MKNGIYFLFIIIFLGCQGTNNIDPLESALTLAADNRLELEKVLSRYKNNPEDSLKYKAACFLIQNMMNYYYYEGNQLDNYLTYFKLLEENKKTGVSSAALSDTIIKKYGTYSMDSLVVKYDIYEIDSAYLCNNIEWSFKVWGEQPWGKNVSFDDFCEYILPYRIKDEKLSYWKEQFYTKYNHLLCPLNDQTLKDRDDPVKAAKLLLEYLTKDGTYFTMTSPASLPHVGPFVSEYKTGSCREVTDYVIYVCRALGIPCHIDFMPVRGNDNAAHFWVSFKDKNGELYAHDFPGDVRIVRTDGVRDAFKTKVYRYTFSLNMDLAHAMHSSGNTSPSFFERPLFTDVTYPYAKSYLNKLKIPVSKLTNQTNSKVFYLCASQWLEWIPVAQGYLEGNDITFKDLQKGDMWRIAAWEDNSLKFESAPFRMHPQSNELIFYEGNGQTHDVTLFAKTETGSEGMFRDRMQGGVFEGSNDPGFHNKDTLWVINNVPERLMIDIPVKSEKKYKYIRYYGPKNSYCNVSEIWFYSYDNDSVPLSGSIIGTPGSATPHDPHEYTQALDGKTWTSVDYKEPSGGWAGLILKEPKAISRIVFTPRNRDNFIRPGDNFELFYLNENWKSMGIIKSTADSVVFKDVPQDALLYLKCLDRGVQERIFTYEKGKQIWR